MKELLTVSRINRNIVECKESKMLHIKITASRVLIETLWNVKKR